LYFHVIPGDPLALPEREIHGGNQAKQFDTIDEILEAYISGNIYRKDYRMPGCEIGNDTTL
jgi:hypothetical protein